jgi:hypothetical protein
VILGDGIKPQRGVDSEYYQELQDHFAGGASPVVHTDISKKYLASILTVVSHSIPNVYS